MSGGYGAGAAAVPAAPAGEKEQFRGDWSRRFAKATQHDSWGQIVEAQEEYHVLATVIAAKQGLPIINSKEKDTMFRLVQCLSARSHALKTMDETITSADMKALQPVFDTLFTSSEPPFPIEQHKFQHAQAVKPATEGEIICGDADEPYSDWQQSQAVLKNITGTAVAIRVDRIGLKDAQDYIDPFMTLIVGDSRGNMIQSHDIPPPKTRTTTYCTFGHQVYLTVSLET